MTPPPSPSLWKPSRMNLLLMIIGPEGRKMKMNLAKMIIQQLKYKYKVDNAQIRMFLRQIQKPSVDVHISAIDPLPPPIHHRQPSAILGLFLDPPPPTVWTSYMYAP